MLSKEFLSLLAAKIQVPHQRSWNDEWAQEASSYIRLPIAGTDKYYMIKYELDLDTYIIVNDQSFRVTLVENKPSERNVTESYHLMWDVWVKTDRPYHCWEMWRMLSSYEHNLRMMMG